ncbi:MAG: YraN family protein [Candidatus Dadabacteria bacterium]|nr:MAG: YraN family protein [Candidatus Dadabacteria bacterium]
MGLKSIWVILQRRILRRLKGFTRAVCTERAFALFLHILRTGRSHQRLTKKALGRKGENIARLYLKRNNYLIVDTNWRCREGEIDIIGLRDRTLCIVEVRTRSKRAHFSIVDPLESVDIKKQEKLKRLCDIYLNFARHKIKSLKVNCVRIDIICITIDESGNAAVKHHKNAVM